MTDHAWIQSRWVALYPLLAALFFAGFVWALLDTTQRQYLMSEGGAIEQASWMLWLVMAFAFALLAKPGDRMSTRVALVVMMAAFAAREADLHKEITGKSVLKLSFYFQEFPLHQKLIAGVVVVAVLAAVGLLIKRYGHQVWRGARSGDIVCTTVLIFLISMVISKVLDRSVNVLLEDYGIAMPTRIGQLIGTTEESVEAVLPLVAAIGLLQHLGRR